MENTGSGLKPQKEFISIDPRKEIHEEEEMDIDDSDEEDNGLYTCHKITSTQN